MANRTDKDASSIHGTNPQNLIEYIVRQKIYDSVYWKQECFGLSAERLVDKAVELKYVCGMYGEPQKGSEFICLILKMLQIQPDKEIIVEFIKNDDFKYLRLVGAFYMRLVGRAVDIFQYLEPLYNDYRKVRLRRPDGNFELAHIDELIDAMLRKDYMFNIALPRLPSRSMLERVGQLEPRVSVLDEEFDEAALEEEREEAAKAAVVLEQELAAAEPEAEEGERKRRRSPSPWRLTKEEKRARPRSRERSKSRSRSRSRERRERSRERGGGGRRERSRSRSRERRRDEYSRREEYRREERRRSRSRDRGRRDEERGRREDDRGREDERERDRDRRRRERSKSADGRGRRRGREDGEIDEIAEANALRAKLGLRPLK